MNLKAMREAGLRKHLLRRGYMVPNHLMVDMLRPLGSKLNVTYSDVMGFERVSGLASANAKTTMAKLDLIDVLRVTK